MGSGVWLSVVIPAYNEEERIGKRLQEVTDYFNALQKGYEVIVVNDGSQDGTTQVVEEFCRESDLPVRLVGYATNQGKGYAVRQGVKAAVGWLVLVTDADQSTPISELPRLLAALEAGSAVAIGSRALHDDATVVRARLHRKLIGRTFAFLVKTLLLSGIEDTQCGFKLFRGKVAKELFQRQRADGFSFDVEVLFLARRQGHRIAEVPVNWTHTPGSKVRLVRDSARMLWDVAQLWTHHTVIGVFPNCRYREASQRKEEENRSDRCY